LTVRFLRLWNWRFCTWIAAIVIALMWIPEEIESDEKGFGMPREPEIENRDRCDCDGKRLPDGKAEAEIEQEVDRYPEY
jgi:hypothetical protein